MSRKLLISLIILHVKLYAMENLTTPHQNLQTKSASDPMEPVKDRLQLVTNWKSITSQLLTHYEEIHPSKQPPNQTTEVSSPLEEKQTKQDNSSYVDGTDEVSTVLKELQTGVPEAQNDVVPFKSASDYLKRMSLVEEGSQNSTYSERYVYMPVGGSEMISCIERLDLRSTVKSIAHVWTDHLGKEIKRRRQSRLKVDERFRLSITEAQMDDVGIYHCLLNIVYTDGGEAVKIDNVVSLNVYDNPDLALEFPFVFDSTTCDKERDRKKLNAIKDIICTTNPCVYEFEMTCSTEPWRHVNMPYIPHSKLLILVTKYSDPEYRPPECSRDCLMANKFDHLLANLEIVKKAVDMTANDSSLTFFSGLTLSNRKLVYSCNAGFSLYRESCVPCFPGTYNPKKRINLCVACPMNTYMEQPGARDCLQCEPDKRTVGVGADSIKKCVDKQIKIIRFRMAFYIVCGVVGGILGILSAIFIVKIRDKLKRFFIPDDQRETPSEKSSKLVIATQHEPPKGTIPGSTLPMQKKPSANKLPAAIAEPENLQSVLQGARERLKKTSEERNETTSQSVDDKKALKAAVFYPTAHRPSKDLATRPSELAQLENKATEKLKKKRKNDGIHDAANITIDVANQPSQTAAEHPANQPEGQAMPDKDFLGKPKRERSHMSDIIRQSFHSMTSLAAEFTLPVSEKKSKRTKLSKKMKQPTSAFGFGSRYDTQPQLHDLVHASRHRISQSNLHMNTVQKPVITPSNALITSYQPSKTGSAVPVQSDLSSSYIPNRQALPLAAPSDRSQARRVHVPPDTSNARPIAIPVGQIQPPDQPDPSNPNIFNPQINSVPWAQQAQINPPQVGMSLPQMAASGRTQAFQTVALTPSSTNVSAAAGQQKAPSKNLNQNSVFINDYSDHGLLKRKGLEMNYAERGYSTEDQASRDQHLAQLSPPHYLYDEIFWMPNATTAAPSHTNIPLTAHGKAPFAAQEGPSNTNFNQKSTLGYSHVSGSQENQNGGEQNTYKTSSYALQDPLQSQSTYSIQQSNYYPDSWPGYHNIRQHGYRGNPTGLEQ